MSQMPRILDQRRVPAMALVALTGIVQAIAAGTAAFATRDLFAALHASGAIPITPLLVLLAAGLAIALLRLVERTTAEWIGQHYVAALRTSLFRHLACLSPRILAERRSGSLALRFVGDLSTVRSWVGLGIVRIVSTAFVLPGVVVAMWLLNPTLALVGAATLSAALILMAIVQPHLAPLHRALRRQRARIAADMSERAPVAAELRLQGRVNRELRRLDQSGGRLRRAALKRTAAASGLKAIPEVALAFAGVLFLALGFELSLSAAETAAALALLGVLAVPMSQLAVIGDQHRAWQVARSKCMAILSLPQLPQQTAAAREGMALGLRFEAVSHQHLSIASGRIEQGQKVAVLGPNGAGKSTLLSLAAALELPASGRITLDGGPIKRNQVCYLGPRSPMLRGSLRRALTMGVANRPSDKKIIRTARSYGLAPLLERLGGLDGSIAEAGRNLSSGEARRVHLVRAALSQTALLLLDEPDDALDPQGRQLVAKLIRETSATTICVTHDLALARSADQVWFVANGELEVEGDPETLLSQAGPVRDFVRPRSAA